MSWFSMVAELGINIKPYVQGLFRARSEAKMFGREVAGELKNHLAGAFGVAAILEFTKKTVEFGSAINDLADRLEVSTKGLQEWNYAASQNGAKAEDVVMFFEHIAAAREKALTDDDAAIESFKRLGVAFEDLRKLRTEDIGKKIAEGVRGGDIQKLTGDLREIGGKSATRLVPAFKQGISEAADEANRLGLVMGNSVVAALDRAGDSADRLKKSLMTTAAPALGTLFTRMTQTMELFKAFGANGNWTKLFQTGGGYEFIKFLNSKQAQDIVAANETPTGKELPKSSFDYRPPSVKPKFDNELLGKQVGRLNVDNLAQVGGFIGRAASVNQVVDVARQQLLVQKKIAENTEPSKGGKDTYSYK